MPRGGYRPGSGRKPKHHQTGTVDAFAGDPAQSTTKAKRRGARSPLRLLLDVVADESQPLETRMKAARDALPFTHRKPGDVGKKEAKLKTARRLAAGGKFGRRTSVFSPGEPPRVVPFRKTGDSK